MSKVTNIILMDNSDGAFENVKVKSIYNVLNLSCIDNQAVGGDKSFEVEVWVGAFNYLYLEEYVQKIRNVFGKYIEDVQLFVKEQDDEKWSEYDLQEGGI